MNKPTSGLGRLVTQTRLSGTGRFPAAIRLPLRMRRSGTLLVTALLLGASMGPAVADIALPETSGLQTKSALLMPAVPEPKRHGSAEPNAASTLVASADTEHGRYSDGEMPVGSVRALVPPERLVEPKAIKPVITQSAQPEGGSGVRPTAKLVDSTRSAGDVLKSGDTAGLPYAVIMAILGLLGLVSVGRRDINQWKL